MDKPIFITPQFAVTSALDQEDFPAAAAAGFRSILSNRPDGEAEDQLSARAEAVLAWRAGLQFRHVPAPKLEIFTDKVVEGMADAVATLNGPILAHCASGLRSAIAWAAASARTENVDCVLKALAQAGFDLEFLRDDLETQADRARWIGPRTPALDCAEAAKLETATAA
jgi:sulfide:quinone oxidoreductase